MTLCFSKRQFKPQTHCKHKFTNKIPFHHSSVVCAVMKSKVVPACKVKKKKKREFWKKKVCSYNALITASSRDRCPSLTHEIRSPLLCPVICRPHIQTYLSVNTRLLHIHSHTPCTGVFSPVHPSQSGTPEALQQSVCVHVRWRVHIYQSLRAEVSRLKAAVCNLNSAVRQLTGAWQASLMTAS